MKNESRPAFDAKFWNSFTQRAWEKRAQVYVNQNSDLKVLDAATLFSMIVRSSDHCRKVKSSEGFKFYIDGEKVRSEDVLQILPVQKDRSLEGYHARMERRFEDYCLVCDELLKVNKNMEVQLSELTDGLYDRVGLPNRFSEMGLYLGNYRKTPFGVHVDGCGVFSFPVIGTKRFRIWESSFVKKNPQLAQSFNYVKYKSASRLLVARPGDMAYWPSSAWHIAESTGEFSATWSLGVWVDQDPLENVSQLLKQVLQTKMKRDLDHGMTKFKRSAIGRGGVGTHADTALGGHACVETNLGGGTQPSLPDPLVAAALEAGLPANARDRNENGPAEKIAANGSEGANFMVSFRLGRSNYCGFNGILIHAAHSKSALMLIQALNVGDGCACSAAQRKWLRPFLTAGAFAAR